MIHNPKFGKIISYEIADSRNDNINIKHYLETNKKGKAKSVIATTAKNKPRYCVADKRS